MRHLTVRLPAALLAEVDELAGRRGRNAWIVSSLTDRVKRERLGWVLDETRGALRDSPYRKTADETYRWVRELREE